LIRSSFVKSFSMNMQFIRSYNTVKLKTLLPEECYVVIALAGSSAVRHQTLMH